MLVSVVIRTLNEQRYLRELLLAVRSQKSDLFTIETVIIDSGSVDSTIEIAKEFGCRVTYISREDFTFGRSLNFGCEYAKGQIFVLISGHCVPTDENWLHNLVVPIAEGLVSYSYGRQVGRDSTKFSEIQLFEKYFPTYSKIPQKGFFVNNANSALSRELWEKYRFDEELTGLEDMDLAKRYVGEGGEVAYVSQANVYHIHDEKWSNTKRRYEREALALQKIMPEIQVSIGDGFRYFFAAIMNDFSKALVEQKVLKEWLSILKFRSAQYVGTYLGNHEHRKWSKERKDRYFYPTSEI
jgi:rhamnosyltransferase